MTFKEPKNLIHPILVPELPDMFSVALEKINGMDLSLREIDVIACTISGRSGKETAAQLSIAHSTVEAHINNIKDLLNCNGRSNIINLIEKSGKYSLYKKHYINLLIYPAFEAILKKYGNVIKNNLSSNYPSGLQDNFPKIYLGILNQGQELYLKFAKKLNEDLKLLGITTKIKAFNLNQEGDKDNLQIANVIKKIEQEKSQMVFLGNFSVSLGIDINSSMSNSFGHSTSTCTKINLQEEFKNIYLLNSERSKNYYDLFFEILNKTPNFPQELLKQIIFDFENERLTLDSSNSNFDFNLNLTLNSNSSPNPNSDSTHIKTQPELGNKSFENNSCENIIHLIKKREKNYTVLSLFCLCFVIVTTLLCLSIKNDVKTIRWNLPRQDHLFVGRAKALETLETMHQKMEAKTGKDFRSRNQHTNTLAISACAGLGGIGKTQLALQYAHHTKHPYTLIAWFPAENVDELQQKLIEFSQWAGYSEEKPSISEALPFVKKWFEEHPGWLLIFDNVNYYDEIKSYLPLNGGDIILTSRYRSWPSSFNVLDFDVMSEGDAVLLLKSLIKFESKKNIEPELKEIARQLGYLPLAMAHAGAYIQQNHCSVDDYIKLYNASMQDCLSSQTMPEGTHGLSVASTWNISIAAIAKEAKAQNQPLYSLELLLACAYLSPDKISKNLLLAWFKERYPDLDRPEFILSEAIGQLWKYSLINLDGESNISIHRLVQSTLQQQYCKQTHISNNSKNRNSSNNHFPLLDEAMYKTMLIAVHKEFNRFSQSSDDKDTRQNLLPHLQSLMLHCDKLWPKSTLLKASLSDVIYDLGVLFNHLSQAKPAIVYFDRSKTMKSEIFGKDHFETISPLLRLGMAYRALGDELKSKAILEKVLALRKQYRSGDDLELALILSALGVTYKNLGMYEVSMSAHETALNIQERYDGKESLEVAKTLICMSNTLGYLGKPKEQKETGLRALTIFEKHHDKNSTHISKAQANIGYAEISLGNLESAKIFLEKSLKLREQFFGKNHYWVAYTLSYLGHVYCELGDFERAQSLLNSALDIKQEYHGKHHYEVAKTLVYLGILHKNLRDYQQAKNLLERALEINEKHYGKDHFEVAKTLVELGEIYSELESREALPLLQKALKMQTAFYGENHLETSYSLSGLGFHYLKLDHLDTAKEMLEKALAIQTSNLEMHTPKIAKTLHYLSLLYHKMGDHDKAKSYSMRSDEIFLKYFGKKYNTIKS